MQKIDLSEDIIYLRINYNDALNPTTNIIVERENELFIFDEDFYNMHIIKSKEDLIEFLKEQDNYIGEPHIAYWFEDKNNQRVKIKIME